MKAILFLCICASALSLTMEEIINMECDTSHFRNFPYDRKHTHIHPPRACGLYQGKCMSRDNYSIYTEIQMNGVEGSQPTSYSTILNLFWGDNCSIENQFAHLYLFNHIVSTAVYHTDCTVKVTTINVSLKRKLSKEYLCNKRMTPDKVYSMENLICSHNRTRDIFAISRRSIDNVYSTSMKFGYENMTIVNRFGNSMFLRMIDDSGCIAANSTNIEEKKEAPHSSNENSEAVIVVKKSKKEKENDEKEEKRMKNKVSEEKEGIIEVESGEKATAMPKEEPAIISEEKDEVKEPKKEVKKPKDDLEKEEEVRKPKEEKEEKEEEEKDEEEKEEKESKKEVKKPKDDLEKKEEEEEVRKPKEEKEKRLTKKEKLQKLKKSKKPEVKSNSFVYQVYFIIICVIIALVLLFYSNDDMEVDEEENKTERIEKEHLLHYYCLFAGEIEFLFS